MKNSKVKITINPMKNAVVLLDMGVTSVSIIDKLVNKFPNENICYINDFEYGEYEGHDPSDIKSRIKKILEFIKNNQPKMLYVLNSVFIEYGEEVFDDLGFPVYNIVKTIVDYVNSKYEYKNIAFLANDGMIDANIYQKAFRYSHLYNCKVNELIDVANKKLMKTKESFNAVRDIAIGLAKKEIDIIVTPEINLLLLYTEFGEYFKDVELVRTDEAILETFESELNKFDNNASPDKVKDVNVFMYFNTPDMYREDDAFRKLVKANYAILDYSIKK